jgi:hypothetical protein
MKGYKKKVNYTDWSPRVEAGKNTSTVITESSKRRRKGNPVVSDDQVMGVFIRLRNVTILSSFYYTSILLHVSAVRPS